MNPDARRHSFRLKRIEDLMSIKLEAVARENFLIAPNAESIEAAEIVGERLMPTRSELVSMGYERERVNLLSVHDDTSSEREYRMGEDHSAEQMESAKALQVVLVFEVYARIDTDDDGVAEIHRIVYGDGSSEREKHVLLAHEIVSEAPYTSIVLERDAHEFEGHSIEEDVRDVQRVKTALMRGSLDNIYAVNNPRPVVNLNAVNDPDEVVSTEFGRPIGVKDGYGPRDAVDWVLTPYVAQHSFGMLEYWDEVAKDRTGITDASGGATPEMMQNTSATAAQLMSESGIAQADAVVRSVAKGLRKAFRGLLKLVIAHADGPRTVRMKGQWIEYDPTVWNVDMDCRINVGLGGGTKERDLAVLGMIYERQKEIMLALGADNPLVKPAQLYETLAKMIETSGFPSADPFFTEPDPEDIKRRLEEAASQPDPEMQKAQMQLQNALQIEQMKQQTNREREMAQLQADLQVKQAELQARSQENAEKLTIQREQMAQTQQIELARIEADLVKHRESEATRAAMGAPLPDYFPGGLNG